MGGMFELACQELAGGFTLEATGDWLLVVIASILCWEGLGLVGGLD